LYDPEPETTLMALQGPSCLGPAIPCPTRLQVLEVVAEDQEAETEDQEAENEDQEADAKCSYVTA